MKWSNQLPNRHEHEAGSFWWVKGSPHEDAEIMKLAFDNDEPYFLKAGSSTPCELKNFFLATYAGPIPQPED